MVGGLFEKIAEIFIEQILLLFFDEVFDIRFQCNSISFKYRLNFVKFKAKAILSGFCG